MRTGSTRRRSVGALRHDAIEDQGGLAWLVDIRFSFGDRVARIVADCTDSEVEPKPPWQARKEAYLESLAKKPADSLLFSLADKTHNARAIVDNLTEHDALASAFDALLSGAGARRLSATAAMMEELARAMPTKKGCIRSILVIVA